MERPWIKASRDLAVKHIGFKGALNAPVTSPITNEELARGEGCIAGVFAMISHSVMLFDVHWEAPFGAKKRVGEPMNATHSLTADRSDRR